ncbi:A disintegrin and metalloproteinase with thrombospondin motifs 12 [Emydura macquarii macquarii]|uniref:A disintegrin and metalloproteinase with thrombospondin motifs 12 n=1 Tax=Emydura macquarii macquarii TaxID=1129001 RepID=UPI00352A285D
MPCVQRNWIANFSFWVPFLHMQALCYGRNPPPGRFFFPDKRQEHFIRTLQEYHVVGPTKVNASGHFLSYSLHHHTSDARRKRDFSRKENLVYYKINHKKKDLFFNLTVHQGFLSASYVLERRHGNHTGAKIVPHSGTSCHFIGTVFQPNSGNGPAVISTCNGLTGYFRLPNGDYFIEPVKKHLLEERTPQPHIIYRANVLQNALRQRRETTSGKKQACGLNDTFSFFKQQEHRREKWEGNHRAAKTISRRSVSKERWVETLVVADNKMIEYHGSDNVESYILTIINMVTGLFHDPSVGNAIHIVLVRLILLEEEEQGLKIVHHADKTLASFCKWQKSINPKNDVNPIHHDVAVLLTRKDICAGMNHPCETLGLSHLSGMCQPHRSCNINEDSGLPLAFTIAHELGHSFGIQHDGKGNDCEPVGRHPYIMSRHLQYDPSPLTWSPCSKEYITHFLDRGWGFCLDDIPKKKDVKLPLIAPGVIYDVHHQCQLQFGLNATFCEEVDNICQTLWCSVKGSCRSKLDAAADGTRCGENKWCFNAECIMVGKNPEAINGGWGTWSSWSHCTRTCGAGVQSAERHCNNPEPQFGGKYCTGERKRYRMCNILPCRRDTPTFRQMQCSEFDTVPYKNEFYQWIPVYSTANPCELHCRPVDGQFSEKMLDAVSDGTPCFEGSNFRDICINGMCKTVGCDYEINSNATEDRCGVCLGDGSACQTVKMMFNQSEGIGYVDIGLIPKGARDIRVVEVGEAGNFLAVRSEDPEKSYLNGGFIIQWNGEYKLAGTTFQYERKGDLENLTASGPTNESVWIQLLFQENNPGIKYEYTIRKEESLENEVGDPEYFWQYGGWTDCSVTCGRGVQRQTAQCVKKGGSMMKNSFCDPEMQPNGRQKKCNEKDCLPRWWAGEWQKCSTTCGPTGEKKRTVLCIQTVGSDEQALAAKDCQHLLKPKTHLSCNRDVLCPSDWTVSNWTECTVTCGGGVRTRKITCTKNNDESCDMSKKPNSKALCGLQQCPSTKQLLIPPLKPNRGKIIIRKTAINPKRGLPGRMPIPKQGQRYLTTTKIPKFQITTALASTSSSLVHSSKKDNVGKKPLPNNSTRLNNDYNYPFVFNGNRSHQNSTSCPVSNSSSIENIRNVRNVSNIDPDSASEEGLVRTGGSNHSFSLNRSPEVTPGYDYLTEESVNTDWPVGGNEKPTDVPYKVESTLAIKTRSKSPNIRSHVIKTPKISPTFYQHESSTPSTSTAAERLSSSRTENPKSISVQITTPVTEKTTTKGSVKIKPAMFGNISRAQFENRTEMEPSNNIDYIQSTKSPSLEVAPKNHSTVSERKLLNATELDYARMSSSLHDDVHGIVGNWSECSTTCGVGAFWRHVECSSKNESDCQHIRKPEPARRCHLRSCANWKTGYWSKCSTNCGGGFKTRDVHCIDRDKRVLRPFHCQLLKHKPQLSISCNTEPCLEWRVEPWNECSRTCGGGLQERYVYCPEEDYCDWTKRPNSTARCNEQPCSQWMIGTWNSCTASCGGGIQQRTVKCINTEDNKAEDQTMCEHEPKPPESQKCNMQVCRKSTGLPCSKDKLSVNFCQRLKWIGKCLVPSVQTQCCFTCNRPRIPNETRSGNQQHLKGQNYSKPRRKLPQIKKNNSQPGH